MTKEIAKLDSKKLKKVKAVIDTLHLLGLSDEEVDMIPEIIRNWRKMVDTVNRMNSDLVGIIRESEKRSMNETADRISRMYTDMNAPAKTINGGGKK